MANPCPPAPSPLLDREGGSRHIDLLYEPIRDHAGHVQGIFVGGYDVTERVKAEAELRDRETRLLQLNAELEQRVIERAMAIGRSWQISPDLLCVLDPQGRFTAANPAFEKTLGWTAQEMTSTVFASFVHPDDLAATYAAWANMVERGLPALRFQNRWRTKQGGIRWISWVGVPEGDEMYCIGRDVTAERQQSERLEKRTAERDVLATIVESTDALIQVLDCDYRFLAINKANADEYERVLGRRPGVGDNLIELLSDAPALQVETLALWGRALAGEAFALQAEFEEPTGARRTYDMRFEVLRGVDGTQTGAFLTSTDVTDRLGEQRALMDAQDALRQSQKMEAVGQLTGGVAHDFNNLLTVISTSVSLLRRPQLADDKRQKAIDAISRTVTRASRLTGQLLAFARRQALTPTVFDAAQNVVAVVDMLGALVGARIQVETVMDVDCHINADPGQFDTAIVNLVVNARDAMDGAGQLRVSVRRVEQIPAMRTHAARDGDFVAASVVDTGCGIDANDLARVFEPFYTTKAAGHGTGLGLSQVFGFAKQSGGEVQVESEVGTGTAFTLYFPRSAAKGEEPVAGPAALRDKTRSGTVLVVEDNRELAAAVESSLGELGYSSVHAIDATRALEELERRAEKFAAVFSDVVMTGMDGVSLAREIRRRWPKLPVVLTSGYSDVLVREVGHGFPMLAKPYDLEALADALRGAIGDDEGSVGPRKAGLRPEVLESMLADAQRETRRQAALDAMHILDTPPEAAFDDLVRMAADLCDTPIALISLIDRNRQWFKAKVGLDVDETPRAMAFCAHAIQEPDRVMVVTDASQDQRFSSNPLVTGDPNIRFYAGAPLVSSSGQALGTLCVIAPVSRDLDEGHANLLERLADEAVKRMEQRRITLGESPEPTRTARLTDKT